MATWILPEKYAGSIYPGLSCMLFPCFNADRSQRHRLERRPLDLADYRTSTSLPSLSPVPPLLYLLVPFGAKGAAMASATAFFGCFSS